MTFGIMQRDFGYAVIDHAYIFMFNRFKKYLNALLFILYSNASHDGLLPQHQFKTKF